MDSGQEPHLQEHLLPTVSVSVCRTRPVRLTSVTSENPVLTILSAIAMAAAASPPAAAAALPGFPPATLPLPGAPVPAGLQTLPTGIIRVANGRFADDDCREFTFSGWNQCAPSPSRMPCPNSTSHNPLCHGGARCHLQEARESR